MLVLGLLGPSLEDLFHFCDCRFSLKTVLMLADQLICRLRFMHRKHISHRDIKPHNFLMGVGRHGNQVYVADMGLAMEYDPDKTNIPSTHDSRRSMVGTPYFAAINNHFGFGMHVILETSCTKSKLLTRANPGRRLGGSWIYANLLSSRLSSMA